MREELERARKDGFTADEIAAAKSGWLQGRQVSRSQDGELAAPPPAAPLQRPDARLGRRPREEGLGALARADRGGLPEVDRPGEALGRPGRRLREREGGREEVTLRRGAPRAIGSRRARRGGRRARGAPRRGPLRDPRADRGGRLRRRPEGEEPGERPRRGPQDHDGRARHRPGRRPALPRGDPDRRRPRPPLDRARLRPPADEGEVLWYAMELVEGPSLVGSRGRLHTRRRPRASARRSRTRSPTATRTASSTAT